MAICLAKQMILFVRSVLWDLGVPQAAATLPYEDNDAMANTQTTPLPRTQHMGSKYHFLRFWVEHDLLLLSCVDTTMNMADQVTKQLCPTLFHQHIDYIMGHVPPQYTQHFQTLLGSVLKR